MARRLDSESLTGLDRLVTVAEAGQVLNSMIGRDEPCGAENGEQAARLLVGFYPAREVNDFNAYVRGMAALLGAYPADFARRVVDPVNGLPSRLKWLPTLADVKTALDEERARRNRIAANAKHVLDLDRQRKARAEEDAAWQRDRLSAEERARQVRELLKAKPSEAA